MNATTHLVTGSAIGLATGNPVLGFTGGFASHFLLDSIPHTDQGAFVDNNKWPLWVWISVYIDCILGLSIVFYFASKSTNPVAIYSGAFGGILTDLIDNVPFWKNQMRSTNFGKKFHKLHETIHWASKRSSVFWGIINQIIILGGVLCYLYINL